MSEYVISFGDSAKYRIEAPFSDLDGIRDYVKEFLRNKFPDASNLGYFEKIDVIKVDDTNRAKFAAYPVFDEKALEKIKSVLSTEVEDRASLSRLNSNAPFDS